MNLPARDDIHLLAAAYAIDAVDPLERARFERHLPTCPTCQAEVASFAEATAVLAAGAAIAPPAGLRTSVLAQIDQTRQVSVRPLRGAGSGRRLAGMAVAAAVLAVVGVLSAGLVRQSRLNGELTAIAQVTQSGDAQIAALDGSAGQVRVLSSAAHKASVLVADNLPAVPTGRTYELWLIVDGTPKRSVTFKPNSSGHVAVKFDDVPAAGTVLAITEEPDGGTDAPTTPPSHVSKPVAV